MRYFNPDYSCQSLCIAVRPEPTGIGFYLMRAGRLINICVEQKFKDLITKQLCKGIGKLYPNRDQYDWPKSLL